MSDLKLFDSHFYFWEYLSNGVISECVMISCVVISAIYPCHWDLEQAVPVTRVIWPLT